MDSRPAATSASREAPALLAAGCAPAPVAQRGGVARVADRPLGPAGGRRAVLAAAGAGRTRSRRARHADRAAGRGEAACPAPAADAARGHGLAVAVHADVRAAVTGPRRDRGGLPAPAALAVPPRI